MSLSFDVCIDDSPALRFYNVFSPSLSTSHFSILHHLSTLLLPAHVQNDELAQRFREEKYVIRMSRSGFGLLVGWLTEGVGGEASGSGEGFTGEKGKRGRQVVMRVVNNHLRFDGKYYHSLSVSSLFTRIHSHILQPHGCCVKYMGRIHWLAFLLNTAGKRLDK